MTNFHGLSEVPPLMDTGSQACVGVPSAPRVTEAPPPGRAASTAAGDWLASAAASAGLSRSKPADARPTACRLKPPTKMSPPLLRAATTPALSAPPPRKKLSSMKGCTCAAVGALKLLVGYSAFSDARQALTCGSTAATVSAAFSASADGAVAVTVAVPPLVAGSATWPRRVLLAISVTVATGLPLLAGVTRILSSRASKPVPSAWKAPFSTSVPAALRSFTSRATSLTAVASRLPVVASFRAATQAAGAVLPLGAQASTRLPPPATPAAAETTRSVSGVRFTVCPAAVATELRNTCLPPAVPTTCSRNGAVRPLTSTVKAPVLALVATAVPILPVASITTTEPATAAPVAAVPVRLRAAGGAGGSATGSAPSDPPPQAVIARATGSRQNRRWWRTGDRRTGEQATGIERLQTGMGLAVRRPERPVRP